MANEAKIERGSGEAVVEEENDEGLKHEAEVITMKVTGEMHGQETVITVDLLARGGYNSVWLATCNGVCHDRFQKSPDEVADLDQ